MKSKIKNEKILKIVNKKKKKAAQRGYSLAVKRDGKFVKILEASFD